MNHAVLQDRSKHLSVCSKPLCRGGPAFPMSPQLQCCNPQHAHQGSAMHVVPAAWSTLAPPAMLQTQHALT